MVLIRAALVDVGNHTYSAIVLRCLHTTTTTHMDQGWRLKQGLPQNPNSHGPLTDKPDYSFTDGRPTPLGTRQLARLQKQREFATKIVTLVGQVDNAVARHKQLLKEEEERKQEILNSKLKPKGKIPLNE